MTGQPQDATPRLATGQGTMTRLPVLQRITTIDIKYIESLGRAPRPRAQ